MDTLVQQFNQLHVSKKDAKKQVPTGVINKNKVLLPKPKPSLTGFSPTKVIVDPNILKINRDILLPQPSTFKINNVLSYRYLDKNEREYRNIEALFANTRAQKYNLRVKFIRKVLNPYLSKAFELKQHFQYSKKKSLRLFHGTREEYVDNICTYNFDWRLGGTEKGHRHGKVDKVAEGDINTLVPPRGYDTTSGKDGAVYCISDGNATD
ncbi:hypothetical protein NQ315_009604 [Exocentrus adspersus]|uniref:Poly [ADP-ribose] polymerase n=1 Tax=Exocentrus adspersus TaxID=1586481 RepID=A0AAV8WH38_9CUCU|nr:hypothetical protein NQ315_009604 [Exocentrus adspersus]